jgi:hypothetical protein
MHHLINGDTNTTTETSAFLLNTHTHLETLMENRVKENNHNE